MYCGKLSREWNPVRSCGILEHTTIPLNELGPPLETFTGKVPHVRRNNYPRKPPNQDEYEESLPLPGYRERGINPGTKEFRIYSSSVPTIYDSPRRHYGEGWSNYSSTGYYPRPPKRKMNQVPSLFST